MQPINVGILIFDAVELLDFAGPFEVFSRCRLQPGVESRKNNDGAPFNVFLVSKSKVPIVATGGVEIIPNYSVRDCPPIDLIVIPGGWGTRSLLGDEDLLNWIRNVAAGAMKVTSVCSGALLLAKAGLLHGKSATTHWGALDTLSAIDPTISVQRANRFIDDGVITSAGISTGIDMALHVVDSLLGRDIADDTAHYMEFRRV